MMALAWEDEFPFRGRLERSTTSGGARLSDSRWVGTTAGVAVDSRVVSAVGTALRSIVVGMLGSIDPGWPSAAVYYQVLAEDMPGTGARLIVRRQPAKLEVASLALLVPDRVIAEIRASLSLNISETARALGVERPTIYAWLAGQVTPQRANRVRLGRVADIAASWRRRSTRPPGDLVRLPGDDGRSIADLLGDDTLPDRVVQDRLDAAMSQVASLRPSLGPRRVPSVQEAVSRHGLKTASPRRANPEIDWLTRPAFGDEDD